ncbi:MAG: type II secretion system F family protein [Dehalococcoidia bacterium]
MDLLIAAMAGIAASALLGAVMVWQRGATPSARRLRRVASGGGADPLEPSLFDRALRPLLLQVVAAVGRAMPPRLAAALEGRMQTAGLTMQRGAFLRVWAGLALALPVAIGLLAAMRGLGGAQLVLWTFLGFVLGAYVPWYWLATRARSRSVDIDRSLPDVIDFIVTSVEAGVGMQGAMLNMARKFEGPLSQEFLQVVRETSLGRARDAALESMAVRCRSYDLSLFVSAIVQADQTGISIARVLRSQAEELRERRRQRAREQAGKIPVKMTVPTVTLVFPTLFLLILGPVLLRAMELFRS